LNHRGLGCKRYALEISERALRAATVGHSPSDEALRDIYQDLLEHDSPTRTLDWEDLTV